MDTTKLLFIGPTTVLAEMLIGGHYLESIKVGKQATGDKYPNIIKDLWKKDGTRCFHRGFYPWGLIQISKGIPLLFTQHNVSNMLDKYEVNPTHNSIISGVTGGLAQAIFTTPTQRLKVLAITSPNNLGYNTTGILKDVIKKEGPSTLFKGLVPTMWKRSFDWGIRLYAIDWFANNYYNKERKELKGSEKVTSAIFGGVASSFTMPFDVMVTQAQKHSDSDGGKKVSFVNHMKDFYKQNGAAGFSRGWTFRMLHASWHTVFIYGVGEMLFEMMGK